MSYSKSMNKQNVVARETKLIIFQIAILHMALMIAVSLVGCKAQIAAPEQAEARLAAPAEDEVPVTEEDPDEVEPGDLITYGDCDPQAETEFGYGSGTEEDPYLICSVSHLESIAGQVVGNTDHYKLVRDLDMSIYINQDRIIGQFHGTFDGDGHTITNLQIRTYSAQTGFASHNYGTIKNLNLVNPTVVGEAVAGVVAGINYGIIQNVTITSSSVVAATSGDIAGINEGTIDGCTVNE